MKTNLKLVVNTQSAQAQAKSPFESSRNMRDMPLKQPPSAASQSAPPSYFLLSVVILLHLVAMLVLTSNKTTRPEVKPVTPMMVSLVSSPIPEPELVPIVPVQPEPKAAVRPVVKQKPIIKEKIPTPEPVVPQPVISEPVIKPETQPAPEVAMPKAPVVAEAPKEATKVEPQPEPVIEPPKFGVAYLNNPAPNYPSSSRRAGETGRVLLRVLVSTNGNAETVELENSSGFERLDEAAINAVRKWRFIPAKRSNQAISAYVLVPVKFTLES